MWLDSVRAPRVYALQLSLLWRRNVLHLVSCWLLQYFYSCYWEMSPLIYTFQTAQPESWNTYTHTFIEDGKTSTALGAAGTVCVCVLHLCSISASSENSQLLSLSFFFFTTVAEKQQKSTRLFVKMLSKISNLCAQLCRRAWICIWFHLVGSHLVRVKHHCMNLRVWKERRVPAASCE